MMSFKAFSTSIGHAVVDIDDFSVSAMVNYRISYIKQIPN